MQIGIFSFKFLVPNILHGNPCMRWHFTGILLQQYHTQVGIPIVPEGALPLLYLIVIIPSGFNLFRYFYYYFLIKNQAIIRCIIIIVIIIIMKSGSSSPIMKRKLCVHDRPAIPALLEVVLFYYLTIGSLYMYIPFCRLRYVVVDADGLAWCNIISKLVNNWLGPNVFPSLLYFSLYKPVWYFIRQISITTPITVVPGSAWWELKLTRIRFANLHL